MMYAVVWDDAALDGLAALCVLYQDRWTEINGAVDLIDYRLHVSPLAFGHEVSEGLWHIDVDPIGICFTINNMQIIIESVGWAPQTF